MPWQKRAECIRQLIDAGLVDRIFLSHDVVLGAALLPVEGQGEREKNNPDGMLFNTRRLIPWLQQNGVSDRGDSRHDSGESASLLRDRTVVVSREF